MKIYYIALFIFLAISSSVFPAEYHVDKTRDNMVKFISHAPMDDFEGITDKIDGYIYWENEDFLSNSDLYFEVDLNAIDTGIGLRNRHMRENYLETDKYPFAHFQGKLIKAEKTPEGLVDVTAEGIMFIHGVEKQISIDGKMIPEGEDFRLQADFVTPLTDYNIKVPKLMFFKIDENMKLKVDFYVKKFNKN